MGLYLSHYIGPVLLAKQHPEEEETRFRACSGTGCDLYRKPDRCKGKHCHECGSEVKEYKGKPQKVKKPGNVEVQEHLCEIGIESEALWANSFVMVPDGFDVVYFPNNYLGTTPPRKYNSEEPRNCSTLLSEIDSKADLAWFKQTYAAHIKEMARLYDQVVVDWGIFNYQS